MAFTFGLKAEALVNHRIFGLVWSYKQQHTYNHYIRVEKCSPTGIFCPGISDKNNGLANVHIDRRKVKWMSSNKLLKLRMLFGVEYGYGSMMDTSGRGNGARELTSIKPS